MNINNLMGGGALAGRRRYMKEKESCPYQRVEYLEATNTGLEYSEFAYIDTQIIPYGLDNDFYIEFMGIGAASTYPHLFASYKNDAYNIYGLINVRKNNLNAYNGNIGGGGINYKEIQMGVKYNISLLRNYNLEVNGEVIFGERAKIVSEPNIPLRLFASLYEESLDSRIYSFKWDKGDKTLLDLIPVRVGGEGFMYDKVSGKLFGNAGSGRFVLGPDIN